MLEPVVLAWFLPRSTFAPSKFLWTPALTSRQPPLGLLPSKVWPLATHSQSASGDSGLEKK